MSMTFKLEQAQRLIDSALTDLKENPKLDALNVLLDACESIDLYYKNRFCKEMDSEYDEPEGTTYEDGISLEFYIEADWWHNVSKALRTLRAEKMYDPKEVLTEEGLRDLEHHLYNMEKALFFLTNNADDLHIGCADDAQLVVLYNLENMLETYRNGDGEERDDY